MRGPRVVVAVTVVLAIAALTARVGLFWGALVGASVGVGVGPSVAALAGHARSGGWTLRGIDAAWIRLPAALLAAAGGWGLLPALVGSRIPVPPLLAWAPLAAFALSFGAGALELSTWTEARLTPDALELGSRRLSREDLVAVELEDGWLALRLAAGTPRLFFRALGGRRHTIATLRAIRAWRLEGSWAPAPRPAS